jgi:hypothetical protein
MSICEKAPVGALPIEGLNSNNEVPTSLLRRLSRIANSVKVSIAISGEQRDALIELVTLRRRGSTLYRLARYYGVGRIDVLGWLERFARIDRHGRLVPRINRHGHLVLPRRVAQ